MLEPTYIQYEKLNLYSKTHMTHGDLFRITINTGKAQNI